MEKIECRSDCSREIVSNTMLRALVFLERFSHLNSQFFLRDATFADTETTLLKSDSSHLLQKYSNMFTSEIFEPTFPSQNVWLY